MNCSLIKKLWICTALISIPSMSLATPMFYYKECVGNPAQGYTQITADYNEPLTTLTWRFDSTPGVDGFWLVVTLGESAWQTQNKYVAFYGDGKNKRVTAYVYDSSRGTHGRESYKDDSKFIGSFDLSYDGGTKFQFDIHTAIMNSDAFGSKFSKNWVGAVFGRPDIYEFPAKKKIGYIFQTLTKSNFQYQGDKINSIDFSGAYYPRKIPLEYTTMPEACLPLPPPNKC
ncbi:MAG: hypothetical protein V4629_06295 [Pseudomonadota bacterium]